MIYQMIRQNGRVYKKLIRIFFFKEENVFTDNDWNVIINPFQFITPNDLYLFRHDPGYSCFPKADDPEILVEIVTVPDEICGVQTPRPAL